MPRNARVALQSVAMLALAASFASACAKKDDTPAAGASGGATTVAIELTDDGCKATPASIPAGAVTFRYRHM